MNGFQKIVEQFCSHKQAVEQELDSVAAVFKFCENAALFEMHDAEILKKV